MQGKKNSLNETAWKEGGCILNLVTSQWYNLSSNNVKCLIIITRWRSGKIEFLSSHYYDIGKLNDRMGTYGSNV